jgi:hypothetical protein
MSIVYSHHSDAKDHFLHDMADEVNCFGLGMSSVDLEHTGACGVIDCRVLIMSCFLGAFANQSQELLVQLSMMTGTYFSLGLEDEGDARCRGRSMVVLRVLLVLTRKVLQVSSGREVCGIAETTESFVFSGGVKAAPGLFATGVYVANVISAILSFEELHRAACYKSCYTLYWTCEAEQIVAETEPAKSAR